METSSRFSFGNPPDLSVRSSQESKIVRVIKKANTEATIPLEKMSEEE
jgi:hypothetical protein